MRGIKGEGKWYGDCSKPFVPGRQTTIVSKIELGAIVGNILPVEIGTITLLAVDPSVAESIGATPRTARDPLACIWSCFGQDNIISRGCSATRVASVGQNRIIRLG